MEAARIKLSQKALSELLIGFRTKFDRHKSSYKFTIKICGEKYSIYN
jgi:hypothetical protein